MAKTYPFSIVQKNIYFNMLELMTEGVESKLTAYDLLPVVAAPIVYLDFKTTPGSVKKSLIIALENKHNRGKLKYFQYSFDSLIDKLNADWIEDLDEKLAQKYLTDFWLIDGFDSEGYAIINQKYYDTYLNIKNKTQDAQRIEYGVQSLRSSKARKVDNNVDDATILGHHVYLWKLRTEGCFDELEGTEICCVNNPDNMPYDATQFATYDDYINTCKFTKTKRGSVPYAWWEFVNIVEEGDFIMLYDTQVRDVVRGVGIVGKYYFDPERTSHQCRREVNWILKETVATPHNFTEGGIWARIIYNEEVLEKCKPLIEYALKNQKEQNS